MKKVSLRGEGSRSGAAHLKLLSFKVSAASEVLLQETACKARRHEAAAAGGRTDSQNLGFHSHALSRERGGTNASSAGIAFALRTSSQKKMFSPVPITMPIFQTLL